MQNEKVWSAALRSPAKLNLMLGITTNILEGKHELKTIFTTLDFADNMVFYFDGSQPRDIALELSSGPDIEPLSILSEDNIVYKTVILFEEIIGKKIEGHLHIKIDKLIPHEAGLAGGSSNAATTLKVLADIFDIPLLSAPVLETAKILGADVSFFLYGGCALMGGFGQELLRALPKPKLDLVLVRPKKGISTKEAYAAFDADPHPMPEYEELLRLLAAGMASPKKVAKNLANNLAPIANLLVYDILNLTNKLKSTQGVYNAMLAGSGSTVFGVCDSLQTAQQVANRFKEQNYWALACTT